MPYPKVLACCRIIAEKRLTNAFAESATAGSLTAAFSDSPESRKILMGAIVCYDACIKETLLGIDPEFVKKYTPESAEVTAAITNSLKSGIEADVYVGVTGLTTLGGSETPEKPVGTIFIHVNYRGHNFPACKVFKGGALAIRRQAINLVATTLMNLI